MTSRSADVCLCIVGCLPEQGIHDPACKCEQHIYDRCQSSYYRVLERMDPEVRRKWLEGDWEPYTDAELEKMGFGMLVELEEEHGEQGMILHIGGRCGIVTFIAGEWLVMYLSDGQLRGFDGRTWEFG